jgi:hypothetical protein
MDPNVAKQFLISRIIEQAELERVHLSEIEKKMLYFSEGQLATPDMSEVVAEFERRYDSDEYENKVIGLLERARSLDLVRSPQFKETWDDVISALKQENHYVLVMIYRAFPEYRKSIRPTHRLRDYMIYIAIGIAVVFVCVAIAIWSQ